jgi:hypothetical protein
MLVFIEPTIKTVVRVDLEDYSWSQSGLTKESFVKHAAMVVEGLKLLQVYDGDNPYIEDADTGRVQRLPRPID